MLQQQEIIEKLLPFVLALRAYHRHTVVGIENFPKEGPALIVTNHSLATYDITLLASWIYQEIGRIPVPLVDRLFFRIPYLGEFMEATGARQGNPETARQLLEEGHMLCVAPGGMREALRPSSERYQIRWDRRYGFVKLALQTGSPIVLAACPKADDIYEVYPSWITAWAYRNFRVPLFLARGVGLSPLPKPAKLTHFVMRIDVPKASDDPEEFQQQLKALHDQVVTNMEKLMSKGIFYRGDKLKSGDE